MPLFVFLCVIIRKQQHPAGLELGSDLVTAVMRVFDALRREALLQTMAPGPRGCKTSKKEAAQRVPLRPPSPDMVVPVFYRLEALQSQTAMGAEKERKRKELINGGDWGKRKDSHTHTSSHTHTHRIKQQQQQTRGAA